VLAGGHEDDRRPSALAAAGANTDEKKESDAMATNRLHALEAQGQSIWQDNITRSQIASGGLKRLVEEDGLTGVTSNPTIFQRAISGSADYDEQLAQLARQGRDAAAIVDALIVTDIRDAADVLRPVWERTQGHDGFVSIEVEPRFAHDTAGSIAEAHRLWEAVNRPNLMIKIPGTVEGVPAIRQCLIDGLNINITLLFAISRYEAVADAFLDAATVRLRQGQPVAKVASVASFFVSRVDTIVDRAIVARLDTERDPATRARLVGLLGTVAVANARLAYRRFEELFGPENARFQTLAARGAQTQRPLWASTSMKDTRRRDVYYVEELIAPDTINTLPQATIDAFRAHGEVRGATAKVDVDGARRPLQVLAADGIDLDSLTAELEVDGIGLFAAAFAALTQEVARKAEPLRRRSQ
jgi:transaldolase